MVNLEPFRDVIVQYRKWLEEQRPSACKFFLKRLSSRDSAKVEGALGEAVAWNWLEPRCGQIELQESGDGGLDFVCSPREGVFLVEVTTLTIAKASKRTGLDHELAERGPKFYGTATTAIKEKILAKCGQDKELSRPLVIFVVTLHFEVTAIAFQCRHLEELLVGKRVLTWKMNADLSGPAGPLYERCTSDHSLFFESETQTLARRNVSAVLIGGFGIRPPDCVVRGVLHPDPVRPFDPGWLPDVCFGRIEPWPLCSASRVSWQNAAGVLCDDEAEEERARRAAEQRLRRAGYGHVLDEIQREIRRRGGEIDL